MLVLLLAAALGATIFTAIHFWPPAVYISYILVPLLFLAIVAHEKKTGHEAHDQHHEFKVGRHKKAEERAVFKHHNE